MTDPIERKVKISGRASGKRIHLEFDESPEYAHDIVVYLTSEDDKGMVPLESFYALPLWAISAIHDYYERWKPDFPGDS